MAVSTKTKVVAALAALDLARKLAALREERIDRDRSVEAMRRDLSSWMRGARERAPHPRDYEIEWGMPPSVHRRSWASRHFPAWVAVVGAVIVASAAIAGTARMIARRDDVDEVKSRAAGALRAGSSAIEAGATKVVQGGSNLAAGTAAAAAAGSTAIRTATVERAREELDERVVEPAKRKAITIGAASIAGLTAYIIIVCVLVVLAVEAIG